VTRVSSKVSSQKKDTLNFGVSSSPFPLSSVPHNTCNGKMGSAGEIIRKGGKVFGLVGTTLKEEAEKSEVGLMKLGKSCGELLRGRRGNWKDSNQDEISTIHLHLPDDHTYYFAKSSISNFVSSLLVGMVSKDERFKKKQKKKKREEDYPPNLHLILPPSLQQQPSNSLSTYDDDDYLEDVEVVVGDEIEIGKSLAKGIQLTKDLVGFYIIQKKEERSSKTIYFMIDILSFHLNSFISLSPSIYL